jgi:hypothetical protein
MGARRFYPRPHPGRHAFSSATVTTPKSTRRTKRLEQAVAVYHEALAVFRAGGASYYVEITEENLDRAERRLSERRRPYGRQKRQRTYEKGASGHPSPEGAFIAAISRPQTAGGRASFGSRSPESVAATRRPRVFAAPDQHPGLDRDGALSARCARQGLPPSTWMAEHTLADRGDPEVS